MRTNERGREGGWIEEKMATVGGERERESQVEKTKS